MRYYQQNSNQKGHLIVGDGASAYDLTAANQSLRSFLDLARTAHITSTDIDNITKRLLDDAEPVDPSTIENSLAVPVDATEIWAAGVTYQISEDAREAESGMKDVYVDVYDAERPEVFFKATPSRTVNPGEDVGIREDSDWNVPEPELGLVLYRGDIVGYTIGNDMSSRSIEGENPLYLPQAKVYNRCCSIGPCIASVDTIDDPHDLSMSMTILRNGDVVYEGETSTNKMVRACNELISYYTRHNTIPEIAVLLTGTSLVPGENFTLQEKDSISIEIENIGTLKNGVTIV